MNIRITGIIAGLAIAASVSGCANGSYHSEYTAFCTFEYTDATLYGADSLYYEDNFSQAGTFAFLSKRSDDGSEFLGGFMLSLMKDTVYVKDHFTERSRYCVASDSTGAYNSTGFAIFYDSKNSMPEHSVSFLYASSGGVCSLSRVMVANTNETVNTARFGHGEVPAFQQGDYLKINVTGFLNGEETASASYTLANYDGNGLNVATGWKQMDIGKIGQFDYLDFSLESNRTDLPLYCCVDEIAAKVSISSE